jgi:hypothetical protein
MDWSPNAGAWLGLGLVLVVLAQFGLAEPIRYSLIAVLLFVLLTEADKLAPALNRLALALGGRPPAPAHDLA